LIDREIKDTEFGYFAPSTIRRIYNIPSRSTSIFFSLLFPLPLALLCAFSHPPPIRSYPHPCPLLYYFMTTSYISLREHKQQTKTHPNALSSSLPKAPFCSLVCISLLRLYVPSPSISLFSFLSLFLVSLLI
jgi:hypothetical protein